MVGLLNLSPGTANPLSDLLQGAGGFLAAYGAGGPTRQQAGLLGLQAIQGAQQKRAWDDWRQSQAANLTQEAAMRDMQMRQMQMQMDQQNRQRAAWQSMVGGQPVQGPVQPGQPALGNSPVNPAFSSLPPAIQQMLPTLDPQSGALLVASFNKPKQPIIQDFQEGNQNVTKMSLDNGQTWQVMGSGPKWDPNSNRDQTTYGMQPVWGTDANGKPVLLAMSNRGTVIQPNLPLGVTPSPGVTYQDLGTSKVPTSSKTGQVVGPALPVDITGKEQGTEVGKVRGQAEAKLPQATSQADQTIDMIEQLKQDPALPTSTGLQGLLWNKIPSTANYAFSQKVMQLKARAFQEAYNSLRGGGQISDAEGKKAEAALGRLDTAQSEKDFRQALDDFESVIKIGRDNLYKQAGQQPPVQSAPNVPGMAPTQGNADMLNQARDAINKGADPEKVKQRLRDNGIDPSGL